MALSSDSPNEHGFVRDRERDRLERKTRDLVRLRHDSGSLSNDSNPFAVAPWRSILTTKSCLAIFVGHACSNWGTCVFLNAALPIYTKHVLKFDNLNSNTLVMPQLAFWLFVVISSLIGDVCLEKLNWRRSMVRKLFNGFGMFVPMAAAVSLVGVTCAIPFVGVVFLTIGLAFK